MTQRELTSEVGDSDAQRQVRRRVLTEYLSAWCAVKEGRDASAFNPDWSFLTPGLARWFLAAIDEQVVEIREGSPVLPDTSRTHFFGNDKPLFIVAPTWTDLASRPAKVEIVHNDGTITQRSK